MKLIITNLHQDIMAGLLDDDEDPDEDLSKPLHPIYGFLNSSNHMVCNRKRSRMLGRRGGGGGGGGGERE